MYNQPPTKLKGDLKCTIKVTGKYIHNLINIMWENRVILEDQNGTLIYPIHKNMTKKKSAKTIEGYP